jgi:hypothetical protein
VAFSRVENNEKVQELWIKQNIILIPKKAHYYVIFTQKNILLWHWKSIVLLYSKEPHFCSAPTLLFTQQKVRFSKYLYFLRQEKHNPSWFSFFRTFYKFLWINNMIWAIKKIRLSHAVTLFCAVRKICTSPTGSAML